MKVIYNHSEVEVGERLSNRIGHDEVNIHCTLGKMFVDATVVLHHCVLCLLPLGSCISSSRASLALV